MSVTRTAIEDMAQKANRGELVEPNDVVEYAEKIKFLTGNYDKNYLVKETEDKTPPVVSGNEIRQEMQNSERPQLQNGSTGYLKEENPYLIDRQDEENPYFTNKDDDLER